MENIAEKVKEKLKSAKEKVASTTEEGASTTKEKMTDAKEKVRSTTQERIGDSSSSTEKDRTFEEGGPGTEIGRKDDPLTEYSEKEPMTPAKIKEHEPTAVKREMTEHIVESGKEVPNPEAAKERARRSGMAKGTAGSAETGSEYEQGAAGANK
ncbi:MAG: hypothetical protein ACJ71R_10670 [Nitrososphaeraceae archaeon]